MLEESEWPEMRAAVQRGVRNFRARHAAPGTDSAETTDDEKQQFQYAEALDLYERLTGYRETNPSAIYHHQVSLYGPPCKACGKPLRTPEASFCAACGARRAT